MIEFILLFALGFLTAVLLGLFIAPAVHSRIVRFTERRLLATVPMSAVELRAARDMERAAHAAENRRIAMDLRAERDRRCDVALRAERLQETTGRLHGEIADLEHQIEALTTEAGDLRSGLRGQEHLGNTLKLALHDAERGIADRDARLGDMQSDMRRLSIDIEDMKIDLATRETEAESLKSTIETINEERRRLRDEVKRLESEARDYGFRLEREEGRTESLEAKLAEAVSRLTDQESMLERRAAETARLKDKLRIAAADMRAAEESLRTLEEERTRLRADFTRNGQDMANGAATMNGHALDETLGDGTLDDEPEASARDADTGGSRTEESRLDKAAIAQRVERLRARHAALVDRLIAVNGDTGSDQELRSEIRDIAAGMVSLTAAREGPQSPIHALLADGAVFDEADFDEKTGRDRPSLAARTVETMREERS